MPAYGIVLIVLALLVVVVVSFLLIKKRDKLRSGSFASHSVKVVSVSIDVLLINHIVENLAYSGTAP